MAKNISSDATTINRMLASMSNDIWTIDRTVYYINYNNKSIIQNGSILDDYGDYFEQFTETVEVPERFFYSPSYFSEFMYGTPDLDFLVLYFAKMTTLFEFNQSKIKFLPKSRLIELNQLMNFKKKDVEKSYSNPEEVLEMDEVNTKTRITI